MKKMKDQMDECICGLRKRERESLLALFLVRHFLLLLSSSFSFWEEFIISLEE